VRDKTNTTLHVRSGRSSCFDDSPSLGGDLITPPRSVGLIATPARNLSVRIGEHAYVCWGFLCTARRSSQALCSGARANVPVLMGSSLQRAAVPHQETYGGALQRDLSKLTVTCCDAARYFSRPGRVLPVRWNALPLAVCRIGWVKRSHRMASVRASRFSGLVPVRIPPGSLIRSVS